MKTPMKPINANEAHVVLGGRMPEPWRLTMISRSATPSANRVKISVGGDISRRAALVATKEMPQKTTARRAAMRGGKAILKSGECRWSNGWCPVLIWRARKRVQVEKSVSVISWKWGKLRQGGALAG